LILINEVSSQKNIIIFTKTIIYNFYVDNFDTYNFNLDSEDNNHIFIIMFLRINKHFSIDIYQISYPTILKINISTYRIYVIFYTRFVFIYHRLF